MMIMIKMVLKKDQNKNDNDYENDDYVNDEDGDCVVVIFVVIVNAVIP